jgi:hypothetical protein
MSWTCLGNASWVRRPGRKANLSMTVLNELRELQVVGASKGRVDFMVLFGGKRCRFWTSHANIWLSN